MSDLANENINWVPIIKKRKKKTLQNQFSCSNCLIYFKAVVIVTPNVRALMAESKLTEKSR